jgi:hypothetical protein
LILFFEDGLIFSSRLLRYVACGARQSLQRAYLQWTYWLTMRYENSTKLYPVLERCETSESIFDAFAVDKGQDRTVSRLQLQVGQMDERTIHWLGEQLDSDVALVAAHKLFDAIRAAIVQSEANK